MTTLTGTQKQTKESVKELLLKEARLGFDLSEKGIFLWQGGDK